MKHLLALLILVATLEFARAQDRVLGFNDVARWGNWRGAITSYDLQVTVEGLVARNVLTLAFKDFESDQSDSLEMTYGFSLPKGSVVDSLYLWVGEEKVPAAIKSVWTAWRIYGSIVRRRWDPALLTTSGNDNYHLRVFPFARRQERKIQICYTTPLEPASDRLQLEIPLHLTLPSAQPVRRITVDIRLPGIGKDAIAISSIDSSAWEKGEAGGAARISYGASDRTLMEPVHLGIRHPGFARDGLAVHFDVDAQGETHFLAVANPRKVLGLEERKRKRRMVVLWNLTHAYPLVDYSGNRPVATGMLRQFHFSESMLREGREIADFLQATLSPGDEFNFVYNDFTLKALWPSLKTVDESTFPALRAFIDRTVDPGSRSSEDPAVKGGEHLLAKGLEFLQGIDSSDLFVIDRFTSSHWWDTIATDRVDVPGILAMAPKGMTAYVIANMDMDFGGVPSGLATAYQELARRSQGTMLSGGYSDYPLATALEGLRPFFSTRIYPASLAFSTGASGFAYDVFGVPDLFYADRNVTAMGKLSLPAAAPSTLTVRFQGKSAGREVSASREIPIESAGMASRLSRLWGARKVQSILGNAYYSPQLWEEATDWSLHFRILTPVTALLALEPGRFDSSWYQDQKPSNNPNLPTRLGEAAKRRAGASLALTLEPGFLVLDLSGFETAKAGFSLQVFDSRGRLVADLTAEARKGGKTLRWATGSLRKGAYVLRLRAGGKALSSAFTLR